MVPQGDSRHSSKPFRVRTPQVAVGRPAFLLFSTLFVYIFDAVVRNDFTPDPPGSFIVDSTVSEEMHSSLTGL